MATHRFTSTFEELLRLLASAVNAQVRLVHAPPSLGLNLSWAVSVLLRDVVLICDEVDGLLAGLLTSKSLQTGTTRLGDWLDHEGEVVGWRYVSELRGNFPR